jgi:hypothetical protein
MFRLLLIPICLVLLTSIVQARTTIHHSGSYIYYSTPFKDLDDQEKLESVNEAKAYVAEKLDTLMKSRNGSMIDFVYDRESQIDGFVKKANRWLIDNERKAKQFKGMDVVPSGFFIVAGGKFTANLKIGGGGSLSVGFVFLPSKIEVYNVKEERFVRSYYTLSQSIIGIPFINVGAGLGGGGSFRLSIGLIFGDLSHATDFSGFTAGVQGSLAAVTGVDVSTFIVLKNLARPRIDNFVVMGTWQQGAVATAEIHGTTGIVLPINNVLKMFFKDVDDYGYEPSDVEY